MHLTDEQWQLVQPLIPNPTLRGRPPIDERAVLDGILWKFGTNSPWYDMPDRYPSHQTCYRRWRKWERTGVMTKIYRLLYQDLVERGGFDLLRAFDDGIFALRREGSRVRFSIAPQYHGTWQVATAMIYLNIAIKRARRTKP